MRFETRAPTPDQKMTVIFTANIADLMTLNQLDRFS